MPRTVLALTAILCSLSPALATLSPAPAADKLTASLAFPLAQDRPLPPDLMQAAYPREQNDEYRITSRTAVFLNGRPCSYADVPRNAGVVKMEVSSDNQTVLKIQFRSKK